MDNLNITPSPEKINNKSLPACVEGMIFSSQGIMIGCDLETFDILLRLFPDGQTKGTCAELIALVKAHRPVQRWPTVN